MLARVFSNKWTILNRIADIQPCSCCLFRRSGKKISKLWTRKFGQPAASTHPHILIEGEVTPGITKDEYRKRRQLLLQCAVQNYQGPSRVKDHLIVIPSATRVYMSDMIMYPFRQNTEFNYFSGFLESDSALLIMSKHTGDGLRAESVLFVPKRTPNNENWEVRKSGAEGAHEITGVEQAYNICELDLFLERYCTQKSDFVVWCDQDKIPTNKTLGPVIKDMMTQNNVKLAPMSINVLMHAIRAIKSPAEIGLMKKSVEIASEAMTEIIKSSYPGVKESYLYARMEFECRIRDAQFLAYIPVVAGGNRANIIHYTSNNQIVNEGELVLMDAGCEYNGYTSDLTRTWPVSGKFSPAQRRLYNIVLRVQRECIKASTVHNSLQDLYNLMLSLLGGELQQIGFVDQHLDKDALKRAATKFCAHHVGHYLGMDVHDTPKASRQQKLQPGMIITIEPGLYISEDNLNVPEEYRGNGIRIEDNVLITDKEPVVLSSVLPKDPDEIEALMAHS